MLFDFGGVLVDLNRPRVEAAFDALGFDIRPYLGTYKQSGIFSLSKGASPLTSSATNCVA